MIIALGITAVASFVAGTFYGKNVEAKAIATGLRLESYGRQGIWQAIVDIRTFKGEVFTRIKKFL